MTYPVSEPMSNGIITMAGQFSGFVLTYIATVISDTTNGGDP